MMRRDSAGIDALALPCWLMIWQMICVCHDRAQAEIAPRGHAITTQLYRRILFFRQVPLRFAIADERRSFECRLRRRISAPHSHQSYVPLRIAMAVYTPRRGRRLCLCQWPAPRSFVEVRFIAYTGAKRPGRHAGAGKGRQISGLTRMIRARGPLSCARLRRDSRGREDIAKMLSGEEADF